MKFIKLYSSDIIQWECCFILCTFVNALDQLCVFVVTEPDYQLKVPDLDGGVGCSEYVIHGSNVDLNTLSTSAKL